MFQHGTEGMHMGGDPYFWGMPIFLWIFIIVMVCSLIIFFYWNRKRKQKNR